ncbi:MAG: hypothetical protein SFV15_25920 [Polyangiaceae bacterium]|nr:hypothetical protein [Polyangiaceae bacterium]
MFRSSRKLLATLAFLAGACSAPHREAHSPSASNLPEYAGPASAAFDDSIAPGTVEPSFLSADTASRQALSKRTAEADTVAPVRVATASQVGASFDLTLEPVGAPIRGAAFTEAFTVSVSARAPAYAFLESHRLQLLGTTVIIFLKAFNVEGSVETHFRIEPNSPSMRQAIERAAALSEFGS